MPLAAERTQVGLAPAFHPGNCRRIKGVALRTVAALTGAHAETLFAGWFLHGVQSVLSPR
jgi:hypothetical protein